LAWASDPSAHRLPTSAFAQASGGFTETPGNVLSHGDVVSPTPRVPHASSSSQAALAQAAVQPHPVDDLDRSELKTPRLRHFKAEVRARVIELSSTGMDAPAVARQIKGMTVAQARTMIHNHRNPNAQTQQKTRLARERTGNPNANLTALNLLREAQKVQFDANGNVRPLVVLTSEGERDSRDWNTGDRFSLPGIDGDPIRHFQVARNRKAGQWGRDTDFISIAPGG
jgi:hypothetical protein